MLQIRCTNKLIKALGLRPADLSQPAPANTRLGHWYANLFWLDRRKSLIFMSERTLLSFVITGARKDNIRELPAYFVRGLVQLLEYEGFSGGEIATALEGYEEVELTKTNSASILANLNDLMARYKDSVYYGGGLKHCDLTGIIIDMNRIPQRRIGWGFSIVAAKELLGNPGSAA